MRPAKLLDDEALNPLLTTVGGSARGESSRAAACRSAGAGKVIHWTAAQLPDHRADQSCSGIFQEGPDILPFAREGQMLPTSWGKSFKQWAWMQNARSYILNVWCSYNVVSC